MVWYFCFFFHFMLHLNDESQMLMAYKDNKWGMKIKVISIHTKKNLIWLYLISDSFQSTALSTKHKYIFYDTSK